MNAKQVQDAARIDKETVALVVWEGMCDGARQANVKGLSLEQYDAIHQSICQALFQANIGTR